LTRPPGRVVILNDSSVARGGATGLALMSARMLHARGHEVTFISGDAGDEGALAAQGIRLVPMGGKLLLDARRAEAVRNGIYNRGLGARIGADIADHDTADTVYHLHGWSRILSPAVFDALRPVAARTFVHAHDYFLACPNGIYFDYRRGEPCPRTPLSMSCLGTHCDRRAYAHKLWRVLRQRALRRAFSMEAPWAGILSLGPWMTEPLTRAGLPERLIVPVTNPAGSFTSERVLAETGDRLCFTGRTETGKGVRTLCAAARIAGVKLRVIGDTALQPDLPAAFPEVEFTGWVDPSGIGTQLQDCRAIVVPSRYPEPFGLVAAEASRSGLPVLISDVMPLAQEVAARGLGFAIDSRSPEALAPSLRRIMEMPDPSTREISTRAFAATETFSLSPDQWIDALEGHYARALA